MVEDEVVNEEAVKDLDTFYTAVREKLKERKFQITYEQAQAEVKEDAMKEIKNMMKYDPGVFERYRQAYPEHPHLIDDALEKIKRTAVRFA
jgi:hypothetical protein